MMRLVVTFCALAAVSFAGAWSAGQTESKRAFSNATPAEVSPSPAQRYAAKPPSSGRAVALDVTIAELADSAKSAVSLPLESPQKTLEIIRELESQGKVALVTRARLTTVDGRPAMLQIGEQANVATSRRMAAGRAARDGGGFGEAVAQFTRQNIGLVIGATPRVQADGSLAVDFEFEKSQIAARPQRGDAADAPPPGVMTMKAQTTLHIPAGQTVIVGGTQMASPSESGQTIVLVSAQVSAGAGDKEPSDASAADAAHEPPMTKIFHLQHASAISAAKLVQNLYRSPTLICASDERTNSLITRGKPSELAEVEAVLERLDAAGK
jgi:type II secretory pathway component GspD/PulD (secretin)